MSEHGALGRHPQPGDRLGDYTLSDRIGAGGMATVFRASDASGRAVAIKVMNPSRVAEEDVKRFAREFQALSRIDHDNVVRVFGTGVREGYPWIAMEYVEGTDLGTLIDTWAADPPSDRFERVDRIVRGLCRALQYVHDLGLVHRDLKPGNVLVTPDGEPKLSDFGVVKDRGGSTQLTMAGRLVGTVAFMAPEQITGDDVDRRTDLYSLGAILYQLLTFRRPIEAGSVAGYLARHLTETPRLPSEIDPTVPRVLERVCMRLLAKERSNRYPSAFAVIQALDRLADREPLPLRGRDEEVQRFASRLLSLVEGASSSVALVGPAGIGKSHLFRSWMEQVANSGAVAVWADALAGDPLPELLRSFGLAPERIEAAAAPAALRKAMVGRRCVLAVDHLDRAPRAAIEALARIVRDRVSRDQEPVLLVYAATDTEGDLAAIASGEATGVPSERVVLHGLDAKAITALLRDRGVVGPSAPVLGRRLHDEYAGNPGRVVDQLAALVAERWLVRADPAGATPDLRPQRTLDQLRREELPVPATLAAELDRRAEELDPEAREVAELLAVIDRPASPNLLERCTERPERLERSVEGLVAAGLARRGVEDDGQETVGLADPFASRVIRRGMDPETLRRRHGAVARALSGRRSRIAGLEVARHQERAGETSAAYATYLQAARRSGREGKSSEVLDILERIDHLCAAGGCGNDEKSRLWTELLRGEALLQRGAWGLAAKAFEAAVAVARATRDETLPRALSGWGRALYRDDRHAEARPALAEALALAEKGAPERAAAARALADIQLRHGELEQAEDLWTEALDLAIDAGSRDGEARARRGLAHLRAIQGAYPESLTLLERAEDRLEGDDRVRAGVMARIVELEIAAGRYAVARNRAETLVELARRRDMPERLSESYGLYAHVLLAFDERDEARDAAQQAVIFARATTGGPRAWAGRLLAAVTHADLGDRAETLGALPPETDLPASPLDDWSAWAAALRARVTVEPEAARELALWSIDRRPGLLGLRPARVAIDAAWALVKAGDAGSARTAAKRALRFLTGSGVDGMVLEALAALRRTAPDDRVEAAYADVLGRVTGAMPPGQAAAFARRVERFGR